MSTNTDAVERPRETGTAESVGEMLRTWRLRRRMSQFELALDAGVSSKHLSFMETGRARPSRQMLLHLAGRLELPLRECNALLAAAGLAPAYHERALTESTLEVVRRTIETVIAGHEPNPALACDRHWTLISANGALSYLVTGVEPALLQPPVNWLRLALHPAGLASRIANLGQWRGHMCAWLRRQIDTCGDIVLQDLLDEVLEYPGPSIDRPGGDPRTLIAVPLRLATIDGELAFFSTTTTFNMALDVTVEELFIETFLPADAKTALVMRQALLVAERQEGSVPAPALDQPPAVTEPRAAAG